MRIANQLAEKIVDISTPLSTTAQKCIVEKFIYSDIILTLANRLDVHQFVSML